MILGFTGTSKHDLAPRQLKAVRQLLFNVNILHLGDCIHADAQAYEEATRLGIKRVGHPPDNPSRRAFLTYDEEREPKPYLIRNGDIAHDGLNGLIAAPSGFVELLRGSGTWATVRYARKFKRPIWIVLPNGEVRRENV